MQHGVSTIEYVVRGYLGFAPRLERVLPLVERKREKKVENHLSLVHVDSVRSPRFPDFLCSGRLPSRHGEVVGDHSRSRL